MINIFCSRCRKDGKLQIIGNLKENEIIIECLRCGDIVNFDDDPMPGFFTEEGDYLCYFCAERYDREEINNER